MRLLERVKQYEELKEAVKAFYPYMTVEEESDDGYPDEAQALDGFAKRMETVDREVG